MSGRLDFKLNPECRIALCLLLVSLFTIVILIKKGRISSGDSFEFREMVKFRLFLGPNRVFLTDDQRELILRDLEFKMAPTLSLKVDKAAIYDGRYVALTLDGKVAVSTNTQPGIQEIHLLLPGLDAVAQSLGATVVFSNAEGQTIDSNGIQFLRFEVRPK